MKYFMSKEVTKLKYQLPQLHDELELKRLKLETDLKAISKHERDIYALDQEHRMLLKDHEDLVQLTEIFKENGTSCRKELFNNNTEKEASKEAMFFLEDLITKMENKCVVYEAETDVIIARM
jgi:hypothetical protein